MADVVIAGAARTPVGAFNGGLASLPAHKLGELAIGEALRRAAVAPTEVSEVVMGQILAAGEGQNPARQAAIGAGLPFAVTAYGINQLCGSGLRSVALGYRAIQSGDAAIVVAGGQESMSQSPHCIHLRNGVKMGDAELVDTMIRDGLWDAFNGYHMGNTAEKSRTPSPPPRKPRPRRRRRPAALPTKSSRSRSPSGAARPPSMPTSTPSTAPPSRCWPSCDRPSTRTARSPPATPPASTTGRPPSC
jgi:hypothetical protein